MNKSWELIIYALKCAMNVLLSMAGRANFSENWIVEVIVGILTIAIILLIAYWIFRKTGLLKV
ncbi:MAG: hypothetical protein WCS56_05315 [Bacilli bacterium]